MTKLCQILLPILAIAFIISWPASTANAAKILGLFAHPSESHFAVMRTIMTELAKREHNVTIYSSHRLPESIDNVLEIIVEPEFPFWRELQKSAGKNSILELSQLPAASLQKYLASVGSAAVDYFLSHTALQQLLQLPTATANFDYDLVIVDLFYTEALLALGHFHGTPTIGIVSSNFENYMELMLDSVVPTACSPINFQTYAKDIGFWKRLANIRDCMARRKGFAQGNMAAQEKLIKKHLAHFNGNSPLPTIPELHSNLAVLLLNNHVPLATPRPLLPNTIAAGGLQIRPPRELPWHIKRFLDEARSGVIYMNLGNEQLCAEIPKEVLQTLFQVFGKHKERVLWTCHDVQQMNDLPKNIMIQHLVPQTDILAHPHVRVFVMNGDLLSLQEGIVRHVPMIGIPIFRNELNNIELAVQLGVGIKLTYTNLTEASLNWALDALLYDEATYALAIRRVSTEFRDRPLGALETAMYWIAYVLRHNGGAQVKTRGVDIPSNQLHLFDLFIFYFVVALMIVGVLVGVFLLAMFLWQRRHQDGKVYSKLK